MKLFSYYFKQSFIRQYFECKCFSGIADEIMLNYQSTSFHDALYVRRSQEYFCKINLIILTC
ncbi:ethanolamine ammonia-lyase subunit EutB [Sporocytophaga myxococcoides]|uniref:ethanolamine ammonia-lyase subunit EutB n=1 Tax=Sporocytophaga myxococcoides TaxID=153721 RepID=UPI0018CD6017